MVSQPIPMFGYAFLHWDLIPKGFSYHSIPWNLIPSYPLKFQTPFPPYTNPNSLFLLKNPSLPSIWNPCSSIFFACLFQSSSIFCFSFPVLTGDLLFFFPCSHRWPPVLRFFGSPYSVLPPFHPLRQQPSLLHSILSSSVQTATPADRQTQTATPASKVYTFFFLSFPRNFNFNC